MVERNQNRKISGPVAIRSREIPTLREKIGDKWKPLNTIVEGHEVLEQLPPIETGAVIFWKNKTQNWQERGWKILSADEMINNHMSGSCDYLYSKRAEPELEQIYSILKPGGLVIIASYVEEDETVQPEKREFVEQMREHGFEVVVELGDTKSNYWGRHVVYYGRKSTSLDLEQSVSE